MSDTPPPELVERKRALLDDLAATMYDEGWWCGDCDYEDGPCSGCLAMLHRTSMGVLLALAAWADGGLIDPSTWTVVKAQEVEGIAYCRTHDEADIEGYDAMGDCRSDTPSCMSTPLYTLSPVPSKETP